MISYFKATKLTKLKGHWDTIEKYVKLPDKKSSIIKHFKEFRTILIDIKKNQEAEPNDIFDYLYDTITHMVNLCTNFETYQNVLLDDVAMMICEAKWIPRLIENNQKLIDSIIQTILYFENMMKGNKIKFQHIDSYGLFLNEITRLVLTFPYLMTSFKRGDDFIIFSNLLHLLQMDILASTANTRKMIRRSLIVCLSFDDITSSTYLEKSYLVEILVNKLCCHYQFLPSKCAIWNTSTMEIGINISKSFPILKSQYLEFKDYFIFFDKICECLGSHTLKTRLKHYFFNKFCIGNIQAKLLSKDVRILRTTLQYLIIILNDVHNCEIIDVLTYFLFGFNNQQTALKLDEKQNPNIPSSFSEEVMGHHKQNTFNDIEILGVYIPKQTFDLSTDYDHDHHLVSKISYKLLSSLNKKSQHDIDIVSLELFEMFFEKRPYLMIHKYVKPYVDFCLRQMKDTNKYHLGKKNYPSINALIKMTDIYEKFVVFNKNDEIEMNMNKNYSFYMNYDIDFYCYYLDNREAKEEHVRKSIVENCNQIEEDVFLLEDSINSCFQESNGNKLSPNKKKKDKLNTSNDINNQAPTTISSIGQNQKPYEEIIVEDKLFDEIEELKETKQNMNYLLLKNIHLKLSNYLNNTNNENLFLTNFVITMLSVPCLQFDPDLVECASLLLDDDIKSKYSLLTVIRYLTQEIAKKIKGCQEFDKFFARRVKEYHSDNKKGVTTFETKLEEDYQKCKNLLSNYIIFFEFLKEFITMITHKHCFESLVEDIFGVYSNLLDDYYYNHIDSQQIANSI